MGSKDRGERLQLKEKETVQWEARTIPQKEKEVGQIEETKKSETTQ